MFTLWNKQFSDPRTAEDHFKGWKHLQLLCLVEAGEYTSTIACRDNQSSKYTRLVHLGSFAAHRQCRGERVVEVGRKQQPVESAGYRAARRGSGRREQWSRTAWSNEWLHEDQSNAWTAGHTALGRQVRVQPACCGRQPDDGKWLIPEQDRKGPRWGLSGALGPALGDYGGIPNSRMGARTE